MTTIGYDSIENILLSISDPNTGGAMTQVPGVSSPKINATTSIYNESGGDGQGIAGWSTDISWTPGVGSISWTSGTISLPDGTQISASGGYASVTAPTYIYCDTTSGSVYSTTHTYDAVGENKIMICAAFPNSGKNVTFKAFGCADQSSLTTGADIAAGTIVASNIASGTITANQIASGTITANEIASNTITASEMNVSQLSAISANLGNVTAGTITGTTITAGSTSSTAIRLNPNTNSIQIYYGGSIVGEIYGGSNGGYSGVILDSNNVIMLGRDVMDLSGAKLRIPVGDNLY